MDRTTRATHNRLWVSGGLSVASLTHKKHRVSDSVTPIELTIRGARERLADRQPLFGAIDTPQDEPACEALTFPKTYSQH